MHDSLAAVVVHARLSGRRLGQLQLPAYAMGYYQHCLQESDSGLRLHHRLLLERRIRVLLDDTHGAAVLGTLQLLSTPIGLFALIGIAPLLLVPPHSRLIINRFVPTFCVAVGLLCAAVGVVIGTFTGTLNIAGIVASSSS